MAAPILLCDTAGMSNERWLECRMHGPKGNIPYTIGGSDVAAIFGVLYCMPQIGLKVISLKWLALLLRQEFWQLTSLARRQ